MHCLLCALTLALAPVPTQAESGPPTAEEVAKAKADCATEVRQDCLFLVAMEIALANPDMAEGALNDIAFAQASSGNTAGAERTLSLTTTPSFLALAALGREEEAAAALQAQARKAGFTQGKAEPLQPGEVKLKEVEKLLRDGQIDQALTTALSIDDKDHVSKPAALRGIVDHHLAKGDFAAAVKVALQMEIDVDGRMAEVFYNLSGVYNDPRAEALVAVVDAQAKSGDLAGATTLADTFAEPRAQINARLVLVRAAFETGATDTAKVQLALILSGLRAMEPSLVFGTAVLTQSADLALQHGEPDIARQHAEAAYRVATKPTVRRGGGSTGAKPSRMDFLRLATVLHLVGVTDKATTLFERGSVPYKDEPLSTLPTNQLAALLVAQVRIGDPKAAETTGQLLAMDDLLWSNGRRPLHQAALTLIDLGFLQDALRIADQLEPILRRDLLNFDGNDPAELYSAILAKDPSLASDVLKDSLGVRTHFLASLALARSLSAAGQAEKARDVLQALEADHQRRSQTQEFAYQPLCAISAIALTQDDLGLAEDAAATRQHGLALANQQTERGKQIADLLILSASFPGQDASSVSFGLNCLEYHG